MDIIKTGTGKMQNVNIVQNVHKCFTQTGLEKAYNLAENGRVLFLFLEIGECFSSRNGGVLLSIAQA